LARNAAAPGGYSWQLSWTIVRKVKFYIFNYQVCSYLTNKVKQHRMHREWRVTKFKLFKIWLRDQSGATAIEYTMISGAMAVALVPALASISSGVGGLYQVITDAFGY
jgi:Flp pilus assembly pilin Flp